MKKLFLPLIILFITTLTQAQTHAVYGVVTTFDSIPLIGVEVFVKSTKQTILTDSLGKFNTICADNDKLKFTAKGFVTQNAKINKDLQMVAVNLNMKTSPKQREYAIGYGYISEKDRTTAIANMENSDTDFSKYTDIYELIKSMGAQVVSGEIVLRGSTSFQGNSAALIVVDGNTVDSDYLRHIRPLEVKSINVIRDGSAAIYGSRGSNGVVLIETKKGGDL